MSQAGRVIAVPGAIVDITCVDNCTYMQCEVLVADDTGVAWKQGDDAPKFFGWSGIVKIVLSR